MRAGKPLEIRAAVARTRLQPQLKSPGLTGAVAPALRGGISLPPAPFPAAPDLRASRPRCFRSDYAFCGCNGLGDGDRIHRSPRPENRRGARLGVRKPPRFRSDFSDIQRSIQSPKVSPRACTTSSKVSFEGASSINVSGFTRCGSAPLANSHWHTS